MPRALLSERRATRYHRALAQALRTGYRILAAGGPSVDAVVAAVAVLEDSPLFDAGRGAVFNEAGGHELDAAVMEGRQRRAGAVTLVRRAKNPVHLACTVMQSSRHVFIGGAGADRFARKQALEIVWSEYFSTDERSRALIAVDARGRVVLPFNTEGMYRGFVEADGTFVTKIFR